MPTDAAATFGAVILESESDAEGFESDEILESESVDEPVVVLSDGFALLGGFVLELVLEPDRALELELEFALALSMVPPSDLILSATCAAPSVLPCAV